MATPASLNALAAAMRSPSSSPPGAQSLAEILTESGLSSGHTRAHRVQHLERKSQTILDRAAVAVGALGW